MYTLQAGNFMVCELDSNFTKEENIIHLVRDWNPECIRSYATQQ